MAEYIFRSENDSHSLTRGIEDMCALMPKDWYGTLHEEIVRCLDCEHSTGGGTCCWQFAHDELDGFGDWVEVPADVEPDGYCWKAERKVMDA